MTELSLIPIHPHLEPTDDAKGTCSFAHLKLGRLPQKHDERTLRLAKYLDDAVVLPQIPDVYDLVSPVASWPMYGNDRLGDCTIAAALHLIQAWSAGAGDLRTPADHFAEDGYWATGSSDTGRFELDVLNFWRTQGFADGDKILAYAAVDPSNLDHVRAAIYLFGGVYAGVALPTTAQGQAVWDVVGDPAVPGSPASPGSWGGHAIPFLAYGGGRFRCVTWGAPLDLTEAFHSAYTDELYAVISPDWLGAAGQGRSPAGFDFAALQADLGALST